jgi:anti-anti-sigma factor
VEACVLGGQCSTYIDDARHTAVVAISGEIDLASMSTLQAAIAQSLAARPERMLVDATSAEFISVRGYSLIGALTRFVDRVSLCTNSDLAAWVMDILGFKDVLCVGASDRIHDDSVARNLAPCSAGRRE